MPDAPLASARARRHVGALAAAGVLAVVLGGCGGAPAATPSATPSASSAEPIFASDEEALAAATAAYEKYRVVSAQISADGGRDADRIDTVVSSDYAATLKEEFAAFQSLGVRAIGEVKVDSISLSEWSGKDESVEVSIYLCRDVTDVQIIGPDSEDATPADRAERTPTLAFLVS